MRATLQVGISGDGEETQYYNPAVPPYTCSVCVAVEI